MSGKEEGWNRSTRDCIKHSISGAATFLVFFSGDGLRGAGDCQLSNTLLRFAAYRVPDSQPTMTDIAITLIYPK